MNDFRIHSLTIQDFKGISNLTVRFSDGVTNIYGNNATGKSTIYDALMWLLFGKDSAGRAQFEIKPVHNPGAMPTVTGEFEVNGAPMRLRKILKEVWTAPRGSSRKVFAGNTVEYSINEVPVKEREYTERLCAVVDEKTFLLLTRVFQFSRDMKWQDRRKVLFEMAALPDDEDIMSCDPRFSPLAEALDGRTVDEYRKVIDKERRGMRTDLDAIPYRLDELAKQNARIVIPDEAKLRTRGTEIDARLAELTAELAKLENGSATVSAQARVREIDAQIAQLDAENKAFRANQKANIEPDRTPELESRLRAVEFERNSYRAQIDRMAREESAFLDDIEKCRSEWAKIDAEGFTGETVCPVCGQALPADQIDAARESFEADRVHRLDDVVKKSERIKQNLKEHQAKMVAIREKLDAVESSVQEARDALTAYVPPRPVEARDMDGYAIRFAELSRERFEAAENLSAMRADQNAARERAVKERDALQKERAEGLLHLGARAALEDGKRREDELRAEQRAIAERLEYLDSMIDLCESFSVYKCGMIEDSVNAPFRLAKFKLFREQINGAVVDCCDVIVDDTPFESLNNAMKINVGLDIIDVLSEWYGIRVPLFVDNAESVTDLLSIGGQVIRLVVSEQDKELRIV